MRWLHDNHSIRERQQKQGIRTDTVKFIDVAAAGVCDPMFQSIAPEDMSN